MNLSQIGKGLLLAFLLTIACGLSFSVNAQTETIPAGSFIVNMGVVPQTVGNSLKPYGLVYDLIKNYNVPVKWAINPNKPLGGVDFTYNGVDYKGGPFIITVDYRNATVDNVISSWQTQGVVVVTTTGDIIIPIYRTLDEFTNVVIDQQNEALIIPYYNNAGIPSSSYRIGSPADLNYCDDMYAMPHADPTWATHQNLLNFNTNLNGFIWGGCHAVSMLEALVNPADSTQKTNFLTQSGLQCWQAAGCEPHITESHAGQPSLPYLYDSTTGAHPVMQFMDDLTPSTENGSEPWYIPLSTGAWNNGAIRAIKTSDGNSPGEGVKLVFGRGFDNPASGMVMYEAGHTAHNNGTIESQIAFERAYFNFVLLAGLERHMDSVVADFSYNLTWTNGCDSFMVEFINNSTGQADYYWDFGDGAQSTDSTLTHLFLGGGPFQVTLAVVTSSWCGMNDTTQQTISFNPVIDSLLIGFTQSESYSPTCDSLFVQFNATVAGNASITWDFGNGTTASGPSVAATYVTPGTYNVMLTVIPVSGCTLGGSDTTQVVFSPTGFNAVADFSYNVLYKNDCDTFIVQFNNQSTGGVSYFWNFGNGITSTNASETITYPAGDYDVALQVNDNRQCSTNDTTTQPLIFTPVIINPIANFGFDVSPSCENVELTFSNLSTGSHHFTWQLNNHVVSNDSLPNVPLIYHQQETINVMLTAEGINNCSPDASISRSIIVPEPYGYPVADFNFAPTNPEVDDVIQFTNLSQRADPGLYQWDFGDGATSAEIDPQHGYSQKGDYRICLSADNGYNCPDVTCKDIPVIYIDIIDLPTAFTPNGDDHNDVFVVRGKDIVKIHLRIFNRWGELVFESKDPSLGWDGIYKGEQQEMEVYDWLLNATLKNGREIFRKGNVTLLR